MTDVSADRAREELSDWLAGKVAALLGNPAETVDRAAPMGEYGLDSIAGLTLATAIEDRLGIEVDPAVVWDHPSVDQLAAFFTGPQVGTS
ncbi:acyl carrier protein [Streptomyces samsunensis]|uniref:Acyl carrier protein n=1 Tax=Streptomyces malaysiensis TaxID=92644 RepID=A0ABX6WE39_STRMQ|nr:MULTISPECIES: acyl carrier protein [Streptomyces]ATL86830.1 acyl carrier protein [Streptomyces malaysiensis]MCQ6248121.1 acyl carrier protein [Streptomyces malaysiensis]NUH37622.1 acyl carrier protein [Streptomyces samsunensis]QDL69658.1 acyl carrier protein [Streptomyces malaysiensis]QPI59714.1 acyl carrier protein [Streptomyces solisilvae]